MKLHFETITNPDSTKYAIWMTCEDEYEMARLLRVQASKKPLSIVRLGPNFVIDIADGEED